MHQPERLPGIQESNDRNPSDKAEKEKERKEEKVKPELRFKYYN